MHNELLKIDFILLLWVDHNESEHIKLFLNFFLPLQQHAISTFIKNPISCSWLSPESELLIQVAH